MIARLNILAPNTGDVGHDMWVDYDHYQNTGEPDVFDNIDILKAIIRGIGNRTADSYFTTLKELFNL